MVGLFSGSNHNMENKEGQVVVSERENEEKKHNLHGDGNGDGDGGVGEFKPIKHPLEPQEDDDKPAKCPEMPDVVAFIDFNVYDIWKEPMTQSPQKTVDEADPKGKEHRTNNAQAPLQFRGPQYNIFGVFQQCKEFGFS